MKKVAWTFLLLVVLVPILAFFTGCIGRYSVECTMCKMGVAPCAPIHNKCYPEKKEAGDDN